LDASPGRTLQTSLPVSSGLNFLENQRLEFAIADRTGVAD
jgi:hypothetical protein